MLVSTLRQRKCRVQYNHGRWSVGEMAGRPVARGATARVQYATFAKLACALKVARSST